MSRRRYKVGLNPDYDHRFDVLKRDSTILGKRGPNEFNMALPQILNSILSIQHYLQQTEDLAKTKAEALAAITEDWQNSLTRTGRPIPAKPPEQVVTKQLRAEAELDIVNEEVDWLKKELGKREAAVKAEKAKRVLEYGPIGCGKGEPYVELDGQDVIEKGGALVINCPESPYDGIKLPDYFSLIVYPFLKARREAMHVYASLPPAQQRNTVSPGGCRPVERSQLPVRPQGV